MQHRTRFWLARCPALPLRMSIGMGIFLWLGLGFPFTAAQAQSSRLERIVAAKELRVCIWPDYYGVTYRNPRTRTLTGIDIDLAEALAHHLRVGVRFVDSGFPQLIENLRSDQCDVAMHGVGITPARATSLQFSVPYLRSDIYAMTSKSSGLIKHWRDLDQPGRVIAVQGGTVMEPVMQAQLKHARVLIVNPPMTRQNEVESGRADAFMTDYPYSQRMLETSDWVRLIEPPAPFHFTEYAVAMAQGDSLLLEQVNQFIRLIKKDGRLRQVAQKYKLLPMVLSE